MSKTVKFDVSKDSPISRSRKIMKKKKRIHFQFNIQRKFKLKTEPYMRALTLKGSNKVKVTFSSAGSSVVIRHKNVFANTRNVTKYFKIFSHLGTCTDCLRNHRPEGKKQTKELAKAAKARV